MRRILPILTVCLATGLGLAVAAPQAGPQVTATAYQNGLWFDGQGFRPGTWFVVGQKLTRVRPAQVHEHVDLKGGYVIPPLSEAHNHNLQNAWGVQRMHQTYVDQGVMYAAMLCSNAESTQAAREALGEDPGLDVVFASACISSSDGHPLRMARTLDDGSLAPVEEIHDKAYIVMDSVADIERKWPLVVASQTDIVKAVLVHSERPGHRTDPAMHGLNGLAPELLAPLVQRAHQDGLRVAVHTESAADFRVAVLAGADWIAHLPGYRFWKGRDGADYRLDDDAIALAASRGITVIATANQAQVAAGGDLALLGRVQAVQRDNLTRLVKAGVPIAVGSDRFDATSLVEFNYLSELKVMDSVQLLNAMVEVGPRMMFPDRRVGRLQEGYEASFLVLDGDPLQDPAALSRILRRVRSGQAIPGNAPTDDK